MMPSTILHGEQWFTPLLLNSLMIFIFIYQTINIRQFIVSDDDTIVINVQDGCLIFWRTSKTFFIIFKIRKMYDYHHLILCVRSVLLTNISNQAPQSPQISHSSHCHGLTPYPTPGPRPKTLQCPRNSSPPPTVNTHLVPPGVPFEIPCPICHGAIERGGHHHHGKKDIVQFSSSNLRAHQNPFTIFQVLRSLSSSSLESYFQVPYSLETSPHHFPPSLPILTPPFINFIVQNVQHSIARPILRLETARGLSQLSKGSHHSQNLAQHPHTRSNASLLSNASRRRDN